MHFHRGRSRRDEFSASLFRRACYSNLVNWVFFITVLIILIIILPGNDIFKHYSFESINHNPAIDEISKFKLHGEMEESRYSSSSEASGRFSDPEWEEGAGDFFVNDFEEDASNEGKNASDSETSTGWDSRSDDGSGKCNLHEGEWERDTEAPLYSNFSCPHISTFADCQANGRPDHDYERWRWKPYGKDCILPRFNASLFFHLMRNKTIAFVGDTLARNQMESLLCLLSQEEKPVSKGNRRMARYIFRKSQTVLIRLWSAWLLHADTEPIRNHTFSGFRNIHLDKVDKNWAEVLPSVHVLVLCSGHWWARPSAFLLKGKTVGGEKWWEGTAPKQLTNIEAFEFGLRTVFRHVTNPKNFKGLTVFRTISPVHYSTRSDSTRCEETTIHHGKNSPGSLRSVLRLLQSQLEVYEQEVVDNRPIHGSKLILLNITVGSAKRPDGHPGVYGVPFSSRDLRHGESGRVQSKNDAVSSDKNAPRSSGVAQSVALNFRQDCMNWCLPGPIDSWNEIMLKLINDSL